MTITTFNSFGIITKYNKTDFFLTYNVDFKRFLGYNSLLFLTPVNTASLNLGQRYVHVI